MQEYPGISGDEFIRRCDAGECDAIAGTISFMPVASSALVRTLNRRTSLRLFVAIPPTVTVASSGGGFEAQISGYNHALNDGNACELVAWHWGPVSCSVVIRPHLHLAGQITPL